MGKAQARVGPRHCGNGPSRAARSNAGTPGLRVAGSWNPCVRSATGNWLQRRGPGRLRRSHDDLDPRGGLWPLCCHASPGSHGVWIRPRSDTPKVHERIDQPEENIEARPVCGLLGRTKREPTPSRPWPRGQGRVWIEDDSSRFGNSPFPFLPPLYWTAAEIKARNRG